MKKILLSLSIIAIVFAYSSCKKCVTCRYEYEYLGQKVEVVYPQECGTSKQIKDFKADVEADAKMHGSEYTCTND